MSASLPASDLLLLILFILLLVSLAIQLLFYWGIFSRLAWYREKGEPLPHQGVSVVICARNEHHHLQENLPLILDQDHPDFEVVVVNHASDDDSSFLLSRLAEQHPNLKIVEIRENLNFFSGKKFPLSIGIKSASRELILVTDADCRPAGRGWISAMEQSFREGTGIVLGYGGYTRKAGFLNRLIRFDTAHIAVQYLSYCLAGIPYMGVGRNMAYRKSLFFENKGFTSHYRIPSGDDDLFINRVARKNNTRINIRPEGFTYSDPKTTFRGWRLQKKRHLSTGRFYRPLHKFLLGSYLGSQILFYLSLILLFIFLYNIYFLFTIFVIRLTSQWIIFRKCFNNLDEKRLWPYVIFYEPMLLLINSGVFLSNLFAKPDRWK